MCYDEWVWLFCANPWLTGTVFCSQESALSRPRKIFEFGIAFPVLPCHWSEGCHGARIVTSMDSPQTLAAQLEQADYPVQKMIILDMKHREPVSQSESSLLF